MVPVLALMACGEESVILKVPAAGFFNPPVVDFGVRNILSPYELPISLRNASAQPIRIESIRFEPTTDVFLPVLEGGGTLRGVSLAQNQQLSLVMRYLPRVVGDNSTVMIVGFGDFEIDVRITATARQVAPARPVLNPSSISFVDVPLNGRAVQRVRVTNAGQTDGALIGLSADPPFSVRSVAGAALTLPSAPLRPGEALEVDVVFSPVRLGDARGRVVFELDSEETAELPLEGTAELAGILSCTPNVVDFEEVPRGGVQVQRVECEVSEGPYELAGVEFADGSSSSFRLDNPPTSVGPDRRFAFDLAFVADSLPQRHQAIVELTAAHGAVTTLRAQAQTIPPTVDSTVISLTLRWDTARSDLDLHLVRAPGQPFNVRDDCYWAQKNPDWGRRGMRLDDPFLDIDDVDGFGPEALNLALPAEERYDIYVQYYNYGDNVQAPPPTTARVEIALNGRPATTLSRFFDDCGTDWHVGEVRVRDGVAELIVVDFVSEAYRSFARAKCQ